MYRVVTQLVADPAHGSFAQPSSSVIIHCISKFGRGCVSLSSDSSLDHSLHLIIHLRHRTRPFLSRHISRCNELTQDPTHLLLGAVKLVSNRFLQLVFMVALA